MDNKLIVTAAPHITSADSTQKIMQRVCIALPIDCQGHMVEDQMIAITLRHLLTDHRIGAGTGSGREFQS